MKHFVVKKNLDRWKNSWRNSENDL